MKPLKNKKYQIIYLKLICFLLIFLNPKGFKAQCDFDFDGIVTDCFSSNLTQEYCYGDDFCFELNLGSFPVINGPFWSYSGSAGQVVNTGPYQYNLLNLSTGGVVTVSGDFDSFGHRCPFIITFVINVHNPSISIPSPIYFALGSNLTLNSTPVNVSPPAAFNWQPNMYFVPANSNNIEDPIVSPLSSLTYTVTVTDPYGCSATTTVEVIAQPYAALTKTPEGSYYLLTTDNKLLFKYDGQYAATGLVYNVYDKNHTVVASNISPPINLMNSLNVNSGDNRYYFNASTFSAGYYTLEVINEKKEKLYLRFIR